MIPITLCNKCKLTETRKSIVNGIGPIPCDIMFIGEAPGDIEDNLSTPFVGPAGQELNDIIQRAHLQRSKIYITNTIKCHPTDSVGNNRQPTEAEIKACSEYLEQEIYLVKPKFIVALGNVALKRLTNQGNITKLRGMVFNNEKYNCKILATFHPASIFRNPGNRDKLLQDLVKLKNEASGNLVHYNKQYFVVENFEEAKQVLDRLEQVSEVAVDIESSGFDFLNDRVLGIAFSWKEGTGTYIPLCKQVILPELSVEEKKKRKKKGDVEEIVEEDAAEVPIKTIPLNFENFWTDAEYKYIIQRLQVLIPKKMCILQNTKFDAKFLRRLGIEMPNFFDTLIAYYLIDENSTHGLKDLASRYFSDLTDYEVKIFPYLKSKSTTYAVIPTQILGEYSCADVDCTFRLYKQVQPELKKEGVEWLYNNLMIPLSKVLMEVEYDGAKVDVNYMKELGIKWKAEIAEVEKQLNTLSGGINLRSALQLREFLFKKLKLKSAKKTKKGEQSTDVTVLKELSTKHPFPKLLLRYRELFKLLSVYVEGMLALVDDGGRIHSNYNLTGPVCVTADTFIWMKDGIKKFSEIIPADLREGFYPYKKEIIGEKSICKTSHIFYGGPRPIIGLKTVLGCELKGTYEHPVRVYQNKKVIWKRLRDIKKGDFIKTRVGCKIWGNNTQLRSSNYIKYGSSKKEISLPCKLTPELGRFIGYFVAEGCIGISKKGSHYALSICNKDKNIIKDVCYLSKKLFNIKPRIEWQDSVANIILGSKEFVLWWIDNFGRMYGSINKNVPLVIREASWGIIKEFLRGYLCDACMGVYSTGTRNTGFHHKLCTVTYTSISEELIRQVHQLLLNAGFRARLFSLKNGSKNKFTRTGQKFPKRAFGVLVIYEDALRFVKEIKPICKHHIRGALDILNYLTYNRRKRKARYPVGMLKIKNELFVKVLSITKLPDEKVYDLTVPKEHSFITNGLISHNTGRLSSSNPNLQNIPKRDDTRKIFIPEKGCKLLVGDYSQIELRVFACYAKDANFIESFKRGEDIHAKVASEVLKIPIDKITEKQRSIAKGINFGLLYGRGAFSLAEQLDIPTREAEEFIEDYFKTYKGAKKWMQLTKLQAEQQGYVTNIFGRKRRLPEIRSTRIEEKAGAQRQSVNALVQGTASDCVNLTAIRVSKFIKENNLKSKLVLLVHDELVYEVPDAEVPLVAVKLKELMEVIPHEKIIVPLTVDLQVQDCWS